MPKIFSAGVEATGIIAIGALSTGVIAIGQAATGVVAVGQLSRGFFAVGQLSLGLFSVGQLSFGVHTAIGMLGVAGWRSRGMIAISGGPRRHGRLPWWGPIVAVVLAVAFLLLVAVPLWHGLSQSPTRRLR